MESKKHANLQAGKKIEEAFSNECELDKAIRKNPEMFKKIQEAYKEIFEKEGW